MNSDIKFAMKFVENELARQEAKWGVQMHPPAYWILILAEEFGEAAKEANELTFRTGNTENYRMELIQTAAVAVNALVTFDRQQRNKSGAV